MTDAEHVAQVVADAERLGESLTAAVDAGVSQAILLPQLIAVMRRYNLLPAGMRLPL